MAGFLMTGVCPSPKSQNHLVGEPVDASEKLTLNAAQPLVADAENAALSCAFVLLVAVMNKIKKRYFVRFGCNKKIFWFKNQNEKLTIVKQKPC
jgi:hypothetical protein